MKKCLKCVHLEKYVKKNNTEIELWICTAEQPEKQDGAYLLVDVSEFNPVNCLMFRGQNET